MDNRIIESLAQLEDYFRSGGKPRDRWRIGMEHEMHGTASSGNAIVYEGPGGIGELLSRFRANGWEEIVENRQQIGAKHPNGHAISLEPGGQFELAARPVYSVKEYQSDIQDYFAELAKVSTANWLCVGFRPFGNFDEVGWMPKGRYKIMREYMPTVGSLGVEMMKRTATVQANIDFADEQDAVNKMRAALSISPLLTSIFAASSIVDGKISSFQSYRSHIWRNTDDARCGLLPFVWQSFHQGKGFFAAYTQWALDIPMYFVYRDGEYQSAGGMTFRQFWKQGWQGQMAYMADWDLHLSTLFPEVRLKKFIELRGCDCNRPDMFLGLAALCKGVFYDDGAMEAAILLTDGVTMEQRHSLWEDVTTQSLRAPLPSGTGTVSDLAKELLSIARAGLRNVELDSLPYLQPLQEIVESGQTVASLLVDIWQQTGGDPMRAMRAMRAAGVCI